MIFTNQKPKNVLVLGGGDGLLIRELLKREHIESIKQIELDEDVVNLAKNRDFLKKLNRNSMNDPKVETIISDAFYYLRNNRELFDAIFIDFPYPRNYNLAKLYSLEFYTYVNKNLKPHGFVVLDAPIYNKFDYGKEKYRGRAILASTFSAIDKQNNSVLVSTIHYAGFDKIYPYKISGESFIIATNNNSNLNYQISEGDRSYFEAIEEKDLLKIPSQNFPHEINRKYINSIFHPRMLHDRTL
jgi:spermidine synthase